MNETTYRLYARHLAEFEPGDVKEAIRQLAVTRRSEGETAFPDMGTVIDRVFTVRKERVKKLAHEKTQTAREVEFWAWVEEQKEMYGLGEQQVLDSIRTPGYSGRKARAA